MVSYICFKEDKKCWLVVVKHIPTLVSKVGGLGTSTISNDEVHRTTIGWWLVLEILLSLQLLFHFRGFLVRG